MVGFFFAEFAQRRHKRVFIKMWWKMCHTSNTEKQKSARRMKLINNKTFSCYLRFLSGEKFLQQLYWGNWKWDFKKFRHNEIQIASEVNIFRLSFSTSCLFISKTPTKQNSCKICVFAYTRNFKKQKGNVTNRKLLVVADVLSRRGRFSLFNDVNVIWQDSAVFEQD